MPALVSVKCVECNCTFGIPHDLDEKARANPKVTFHCPYGHSLHYPEPKTKELITKDNNIISISEYKEKLKNAPPT